MSLYEVQKFLFTVNRDEDRRAEYRADAEAFAGGFDLSAEERDALIAIDIRALYAMGVHPLLLRPFTLMLKISGEDYHDALRGLE